MTAAAKYRQGLCELQSARADRALGLIDDAIAVEPAATRYHFGRGQALAFLGRHKEAMAAYRRVLDAEPDLADVHYALGLARQSMGDLPGAVAAYAEAIRHRADFADAFNNIGNCHQLQGGFSQAEQAYRRAMAAQPGHANALSNLGGLLAARGRANEAIPLLQEAVRLEPASARHPVNLGMALCAQRRWSEALTALQKASDLDPALPEAAYNKGNALLGLGRPREAAAEYRRAVVLKPGYADAHANLGHACAELGDTGPALDAFGRAMGLDPACASAFNNAAHLLRRLGRVDEAEAVLRRSLAGNPGLSATHSNLGNVLRDCGELPEAIACFRKAVALDPTDALAHSNLAYTLAFSATDGRTLLDECLRWDARHGTPLWPPSPRHSNDRAPGRRLRVGYVSGDFRDHCLTLFTLPLFANHDRRALEIFCYSNVERRDDYTRRHEALADTWRNVRHLDDAELAELIRGDRIDILVDLEMHMANGRPLLFARKPAPVQVAWLAYPATTGLRAVDCLFLDPRLAPPGSDADFSERVIRLPDTFWCYDPLIGGIDVNPLPAAAHGPVTFGCLNTPCKVSDDAIRMWGAVMKKVEGSRLVLLAPDTRHRARLLERLSSAGIAPDRVTLQPFLSRPDYLRSYHRIDLGLDSFPYNGHTTSLDSFWMGVPVVSRTGTTSLGRAGLSQLFNLGLQDLAADTDERFVETAVALARNLPRLAELRRSLRGRMEASPLMDAPRFARGMEEAYRSIWREWCG